MDEAMDIDIRFAENKDQDLLIQYDRHIPKKIPDPDQPEKHR